MSDEETRKLADRLLCFAAARRSSGGPVGGVGAGQIALGVTPSREEAAKRSDRPSVMVRSGGKSSNRLERSETQQNQYDGLAGGLGLDLSPADLEALFQALEDWSDCLKDHEDALRRLDP